MKRSFALAAWLPILLSACMFAFLWWSLKTHGVAREADEGLGAHLFQFWLILELFMVGYYAVSRFSAGARGAGLIFTLQILAVLAVCAPVFYFNL